MIKISRAGLILLLLIVQVAYGQKNDLIQITDLTNIVTSSALEITPTGENVIFIKNFIEKKDKDNYSYKKQLWITQLTPPYSSRPLTSSEYNVSSFSISPDGKQIAFVRTKEGKPQIWILPMEGGESQLVTNEKFGASNPLWSPDGTKILFSSTLPMWAISGQPEWEHQRPGREFGDEPNYKAIKEGLEKEEVKPDPDGSLEELRAWLAKNVSKNDPRVIDRLNFLGESDLNPDLNFSHLGILEIASGNTKRITEGFQNFFNAAWAPDGNYIVSSSIKNSVHPDLTNITEIWKINLLDLSSAPLFALEGHRVGNPKFSPDGNWIMFGGQNQDEPSYNMSMIGVIKPDGTGFKWVTASLDRSASNGIWTSDSKNIYFTAPNEGGFALYKTNISNAKVESIIVGPIGVTDFAINSEKLVYALTKIENPSEIYLADVNNKKASQVTDFNDAWLFGKKISKPTAYQYQSPDGFEIDYWVMEPINKKDGIQYPTVVEMHGGPSAMWGPGEPSMWHEFQVMCAKGYGVVYSNPRGSGGYGKIFQKGNYRDWGDGPSSDVLGALKAAQGKNKWIDQDQLFLTGGSYAGYLTVWIVAHDHRFKAAFSQRGVYELTFFMGEGNAWRLVPNHFGYPWEPGIKEILDYNSPQTYVQNIKTPLLIKHGDVDFRTGVRQSELLYKSLKILDKPVEYVRYPEEGHEMSRSGAVIRRIDRIGRIVEFFERYVKHP